MQKTLPQWAFGVLGMCGVVLVGSMALQWIDFLGAVTQRGYSLALDNKWFLLVPIAGAALIFGAATRSEHTRIAAIFGGVVATGYVLFCVTRGLLHSGLDTWLMLGGAGAMLAGSSKGPALPSGAEARSKDRAWLRAIGGAAVLAGFFAPWVDMPLAKTLWRGYIEGLVGSSLWLVPVAGVVGIISAGNKHGAKLAVAAGITVYATFLLVLGMTAVLVFGIGAWLALGASVVALVVGVLARSTIPKPAAGGQVLPGELGSQQQ